jgi:phytanoyl-CoA hydroxylase
MGSLLGFVIHRGAAFMSSFLSDAQWQAYQRDGYLRLGPVCQPDELLALQREIDDIMLGKASVNYARMLMQLDSSTGTYGDLGAQSKGHKGATLNYRKIQDLEFDPVFLRFMQQPLFREICARTHGAATPIACFRAMFMNKPARFGTLLPWHQDRWTSLDRDPQITLWTALDPATQANGCVQIIPGSHRSLINPSHPSGFLDPSQHAEHCPEDKAIFVELAAGECVLLHNWTLHRSDRNTTDISRRAFSVCFMDANTITKDKAVYPRIFGEGALAAG